MATSRVNLRLSDECLANLETIKTDASLKSLTAAIEFAAASYTSNTSFHQANDDILHRLDLIKKYSNELRRNEYIIIALLNGMALGMDINTVPMHHEKMFRSPALVSAYENLSVYMSDIMTKLSDNNTKQDSPDE